jgi:chaperonin GroEL
MGAQMVKEVAEQDLEGRRRRHHHRDRLRRGDLQEGLKNITAGANANAVKRGIDKAVEAIVDELKRKLSKPVKNSTEIAQVGTCSANQDSRSARSSPRRWTRSARTA